MSNYPAGAENDKNAPFNKEERLQGEEIGLFEYLENLEMPYSVRCELKKFQENRVNVILGLTELEKIFKRNGYNDSAYSVLKMKKLISEPQIFIENE